MASRALERASTLAFLAFFIPAFGAIRALRIAASAGRRGRPSGRLRRLLLLPHDPPGQSGARHRFVAWAERLRARGLTVDVGFPHSDRALDRISGGSRPARELLAVRTFLRRLPQVLSASRYDAVVYGRHAFPRFPYGGPEMERLLAAVNPAAFLDVDDALWTERRPDPGPGLMGRLLARFVRPNRSEEAMRQLAGVLAGSPVLAEHARRFSENVHLLPTLVDPDAVPARVHRAVARPVVGWIGTPGNLVHLQLVAAPLAEIARRRPFVLRIVSSEPFAPPGVPAEFVPWTPRGEARAVAEFDVGLMPLLPTPGAEGKCGLKLLQYAAAGVPAVATPLGANREIVVPGETGFHAETPAEWTAAIERLLADPALRARMGAAARENARARWSFAAWEAAFLAALSGGPPR